MIETGAAPAQGATGSAEQVWLALGANLGDAAAAICQAIAAMRAWPHTQVVRASSLYRTAPVDADGPDYINAVVQLQTGLSAPALLRQCQLQEQAAGRQRPYRNAPRTLDIDILLYGNQHIDLPDLTVPHPRMWQRAFVLLPLAEIAPDKVTPGQLQNVAEQRIERLGAVVAGAPAQASVADDARRKQAAQGQGSGA